MSKILCILLVTAVYSEVGLCEDELIKLSILFRHGNRTPMEFTYPNDPHKNVVLDLPYGHLTKKGGETAQRLGSRLRIQYDNFLGTYDETQFRAISSPLQRCKETFGNLSKTLYPSYTDDIPYLSAEFGEDMVIATFDSCPEIFNPSQYMLDKRDAVFVSILSKIVGSPLKTYTDVWRIDNYIEVMDEIGYKKPSWARSLSNELNYLTKKFLHKVNEKQGSNAAGNLLHKIAAESNGVKLQQYPKVNLYSGHDLNIVTLLGLLGAYTDQDIDYCAYIAFEVYQQSEGPNYIQVYLSADGENRTPIPIPGCMEKCPVMKFLEFAEQFFRADEWCT